MGTTRKACLDPHRRYVTDAVSQMSAILDRPASAFVGLTLRQLFKAAEYQGAWVHWGSYRGINLDAVITAADLGVLE